MDDYVPTHMRAPTEPARGVVVTLLTGVMRLLTRDGSKVHGHSIRDADVSPQQGSYPVVIMRAGASASVLAYSTLPEDLASHRYVPLAFDAPYRPTALLFPPGRA